jgi:hypothetical protein
VVWCVLPEVNSLFKGQGCTVFTPSQSFHYALRADYITCVSFENQTTMSFFLELVSARRFSEENPGLFLSSKCQKVDGFRPKLLTRRTTDRERNQTSVIQRMLGRRDVMTLWCRLISWKTNTPA